MAKKSEYIKELLPEVIKDSLFGVQIILALGAYHFGMVQNQFYQFIACAGLMFIVGWYRAHFKLTEKRKYKKEVDLKK